MHRGRLTTNNTATRHMRPEEQAARAGGSRQWEEGDDLPG